MCAINKFVGTHPPDELIVTQLIHTRTNTHAISMRIIMAAVELIKSNKKNYFRNQMVDKLGICKKSMLMD